MSIVVVGGGHNGLAAACRLARAGLRVTLLEARSIVGGAVSTKSFDCGCYVNRGANAFGMLYQPIRDALDQAGKMPLVALANPSFVVRNSDGVVLALSHGPALEEHLSSVAPRVAADFLRMLGDIDEAAERVNDVWTTETGSIELLRERLQELRTPAASLIVDHSLRDLIRAYLPSDSLDPLVAATVMLFPSLTSDPHTALPLLYLALSQVNGEPGWGGIAGGFARLTDAMAAHCLDLGVTIRTGVRAVRIEDASGRNRVRTSEGDVLPCDAVFVAIDPWSMAAILPEELRHLVLQSVHTSVDHDGGCFKFNALVHGHCDIPDDILAAADGMPPMVAVLPSLDYLDEALRSYRSHGVSADPYLELTFPHALDSGARCERHTPISVFGLYARYVEARAAEGQRELVRQRVVETLRSVIGSVEFAWEETLTPFDVERVFGMTLGNVDHGSMRFPNLFRERPFANVNVGQRLRASGIWLCGAGAHPGGLVSGIPGWLIAEGYLSSCGVA